MIEQPKHTPGPWRVSKDTQSVVSRDAYICRARMMRLGQGVANARLIAAAPDQNQEMRRYLPVLERAESDPELWARLTEGLGIATLNGYRAAIAKAEGRQS
jgi:hypothetical protein